MPRASFNLIERLAYHDTNEPHEPFPHRYDHLVTTCQNSTPIEWPAVHFLAFGRDSVIGHGGEQIIAVITHESYACFPPLRWHLIRNRECDCVADLPSGDARIAVAMQVAALRVLQWGAMYAPCKSVPECEVLKRVCVQGRPSSLRIGYVAGFLNLNLWWVRLVAFNSGTLRYESSVQRGFEGKAGFWSQSVLPGRFQDHFCNEGFHI